MENIMQINLWANGMQFCAWSTRFPSLCSHFVHFTMNKMYSKMWQNSDPVFSSKNINIFDYLVNSIYTCSELDFKHWGPLKELKNLPLLELIFVQSAFPQF